MNKQVNTLRLQVSYENSPKQEISLVGFLFYCNGIFLQRQPVRDGLLEFTVADAAKAAGLKPTVDVRQLRVFIAPAMDKGVQAVTSMDALANYKPYEPVLNTDAQGNITMLPIPSTIAQFWPFCTCRVTGKVAKWFEQNQVWEDHPICNARVHICEIDSIWYWISRIPDNIIAKIPPLLLDPAQIIQWPFPIPDLAPFSSAALPALAIQSPSIFTTTSAAGQQTKVAANLPELSADIRQNLSSGNLHLIRQTIANNYALFHPWFCFWPWLWPYFYRCNEVAVVYTDASGLFDTNISYMCFDNQPNVYIWVEYRLNGLWTTVYQPPIPCNTFWDYVCGTVINVNVCDPRVPADCCCNCPLTGELVWIRSVGELASVAHINQVHSFQAPPGQLVNYDRIGLTDAAAIGDGFLGTTTGDYKRPFGGSPSFYMGFGEDLPNAGFYYYRWSYRQVANAQLLAVSDSYKALQPIGGSVTKGYEYTYVDSHGDTQFGSNSVKLGPFTVGANDNLYIIPPVQPNMPPFSVPETDPLWNEQTYDMNTMNFDSTLLKNGSLPGGDGLYEFLLELFDSSGNLLSGMAKTTFKIPQYADTGFSENAPDILLENPTAATADGYNMLMRIDNSTCNAAIFTINVNGAPASSDCCGFVSYKPGGTEADLEITFLATQPHNFAVFSFGVDKGTCGDVAVADAGGMVIDNTYSSISPSIVVSYALSSGVYSKHFTPADLLGSCYDSGTGKAAFAETLSVIAMATDGTSRVSASDAPYRVAAFALEP